MSAIQRIQSLIEIRKPRVSEFFKDYDRLKHGIVTAEQFFRAFSNANIKFTEEEQEYIQKKYGMHSVNGDFVDYRAALAEILGRKFNPDMAAQYGSLSGVTFESTAKMSSFDQQTYEVLKKLRQGQKSRPVIGKNFFLDYDAQGDGIINANQFSRGLSCMYEAFFREYPTEQEIALMVREFSVQRLEQVQRDCMESKELSQSFKMQRDEVDYRAFCAAIGASGESELQEVEHPKTDDPAYKEYITYPQYEEGRRAFAKLLESHKRFRFDFKSFLQARDKRKVGTISLNLFIKALCDAINDLKRVGIEESEIEEVGKFFAVNFAYIKDSTLKPTSKIDFDETFVDYRKFLLALFEEQQNGAFEDQKSFNMAAGKSNANTYNILTSAPKLTSSKVLNSSNSGALGFSQAQGALGKISDNAGHPIVDYVRQYIISRPVAFKGEFQEFDKRQSGKITSNQFMKVISKFIPIFEPGSSPEEEAPKKTEPYYRGGVFQGTGARGNNRYAGPYGVTGLYGSTGSFNRLKNQPGLTPQQLKTLAQLYAVDTTSGVGTLELYTPTPEKLSGGGFYIDYIQFCNDVRSEVTEFVKSAPKDPHDAVNSRIVLPAAWTVYFKIAESLNLRHLKLSDCLNEAAPGDARWNRTVQGRIGARSVQRSLSSLLGVQLSDQELAAVCLGCADQSCGGNAALLLPNCKVNDDGTVTIPEAITAAVLAEKLDSASISAGRLVQLVSSCYDNWQPHRYTAYSYKSDRNLRSEVVNKAESEDEKQGQDVTHTAVKWLPDEAPQHLEHMIRTLGGDQIIYVKGERYSLEELVRFAYQSTADVVNERLKATGAATGSPTSLATTAIGATFKESQAQTELVKRASRALLQLYYELHILRAQPVLSFQEFDRPRAGYVTRDCFARAFVLAGLKRAIDFYPHSFQALTDLYTERGGGRFQNLVDYNLMLRELSQPPEQQLTIDQQEMERRTKLLRKQKDDYYTVSKEADEAGSQQVYDATVEGVLTILKPLCLKYRPKLRDQFLDFDKRRSGTCEASKLGAALGLLHADLNKDQMRALSYGFASKKAGFDGCFEWRRFVEALEGVCGCRL